MSLNLINCGAPSRGAGLGGHHQGFRYATRLTARNLHPINIVGRDMTTLLSQPVAERDHSRGPADAPVTLVEYGDYECPHCGRAFPVLEDIRLLMGEGLRLVFRHYPITLSHSHAELAAEAAEAAGAQGRFWEMHAKLFIHQDALDRQ